MSFVSFARSAAWNYKDITVPFAIGIPIAIECALLAKTIFENPRKVWQKGCEAFNDFKAKPLKHSLMLAAYLGIVVTACYFSATLLPKELAIPSCLLSIFLLGVLFLNAERYKKSLTEAFTFKMGEDLEKEEKRIQINILKALGIGCALVALTALVIHIFKPMIDNGFSYEVSLPWQSKGMVFAEYAAVGLLHGGAAAYKWRKKEKTEALFHVFCAALSFIFPSFYWNKEMRLHHSFYGLLLLAAPSRSLKFLAALIVFDSFLYMLSGTRGYSQDGRFHSYDFINTIVDNFSLISSVYLFSLILQRINKKLTS